MNFLKSLIQVSFYVAWNSLCLGFFGGFFVEGRGGWLFFVFFLVFTYLLPSIVFANVCYPLLSIVLFSLFLSKFTWYCVWFSLWCCQNNLLRPFCPSFAFHLFLWYISHKRHLLLLQACLKRESFLLPKTSLVLVVVVWDFYFIFCYF